MTQALIVYDPTTHEPDMLFLLFGHSHRDV